MAGRTLTQHAVPVTFGLMCAQWLTGIQDSLDDVAATSAGLPVQCGGAAGTLSSRCEVLPDAGAAAEALAVALDLVAPALPWHTRRRPVTGLGDCLVGVVDAVAPVATEVALLSRPEIDELSEGHVAGGVARRRCRTSTTRCSASSSGRGPPGAPARGAAPRGRGTGGRPAPRRRLARRVAVPGETAPAHGHGHVAAARGPRRAPGARGRDVVPARVRRRSICSPSAMASVRSRPTLTRRRTSA